MNAVKVNQIKFILSMYEDAVRDNSLMPIFQKQYESLIKTKQITPELKKTIDTIIVNVYKYKGAEVRIQQFKWGMALIENSGMSEIDCFKLLEDKESQGLFNQKVVDALIVMYDLHSMASLVNRGKKTSETEVRKRKTVPVYVKSELWKLKSLYRNMAYIKLRAIEDKHSDYFEIDKVMNTPELIDWKKYQAYARLVYKVKDPDNIKCYIYMLPSEIEGFFKHHPDLCDV